MLDKQIEFIKKHIPVKYVWTREFDQTKERLDYWFKKQLRGTVKDCYTTQSKYGRQIGIHYMKQRGRTINNINDYKLFIAQESNGLTSLGQLLFQQSVESYVYSILGAQASTRWPIAGQGAKSLRTQAVFKIIVRDNVVEDDQTITINNMKRAIVDTNVILNTAITPGMILVPGSLVILKQKIPGFNNILTMANCSMSFGLNDGVNKILYPSRVPETTEDADGIKNDIKSSIRSPIRGPIRSPPRSVFSAVNDSNTSNIKVLTGENFTNNIPRVDTKYDVGSRGDTDFLVAMFGVSAVGGFVALKFFPVCNNPLGKADAKNDRRETKTSRREQSSLFA